MIYIYLLREGSQIIYNSGKVYYPGPRLIHPEGLEIITWSNEVKPPRGRASHWKEYWCPYCKRWELWILDPFIGVVKCPLCGVSTHDYHVKNFNPLWRKEDIDET